MEDSRNREVQGNGLGLAIAKKHAKADETGSGETLENTSIPDDGGEILVYTWYL